MLHCLIGAKYVWSLFVSTLDPATEKDIKYFTILITLFKQH